MSLPRESIEILLQNIVLCCNLSAKEAKLKDAEGWDSAIAILEEYFTREAVAEPPEGTFKRRCNPGAIAIDVPGSSGRYKVSAEKSSTGFLDVNHLRDIPAGCDGNFEAPYPEYDQEFLKMHELLSLAIASNEDLKGSAFEDWDPNSEENIYFQEVEQNLERLISDHRSLSRRLDIACAIAIGIIIVVAIFA